MITVAIIGILATVAIPNYTRLANRMNIKIAIGTLVTFRNAIIGNREIEQKTLIEITGSTCSRCDFANAGEASSDWSLPSANAQEQYSKAGLEGVPQDPWGRYYLLDENEHEYTTDDCRMDSITTAGLDGVYGQHESNNNRLPSGDDIRMFIDTLFARPDCSSVETNKTGIYMGPDAVF